MEFSQRQEQPPQNVFNQVYQFIQNTILNNAWARIRQPYFNLLQYQQQQRQVLMNFLLNLGYQMFIGFFTTILLNAINALYYNYINTQGGGGDTFFTDGPGGGIQGPVNQPIYGPTDQPIYGPTQPPVYYTDDQEQGGQGGGVRVRERDGDGQGGGGQDRDDEQGSGGVIPGPTPTDKPTDPDPTDAPTDAPTDEPTKQQPRPPNPPLNIETKPLFFSVSPDPEIIPKTQPDAEVLQRFVFRDPIDKNNVLVQNQYNNLDRRFTNNYDFYNLQADLSNPTFEHQFVPNVKSNFDLYCLNDYQREAMLNYNTRVQDVNHQIDGGPTVELRQTHKDYMSFSDRVMNEGTGFVINPNNHERMNNFSNVHVLPMSRHFQFLPHMQ